MRGTLDDSAKVADEKDESFARYRELLANDEEVLATILGAGFVMGDCQNSGG